PGPRVDAPARAAPSHTTDAHAAAPGDSRGSTAAPSVRVLADRCAQQTTEEYNASRVADTAGPVDARPVRDRRARRTQRLTDTGPHGRAARRPRPPGAPPSAHGPATPASSPAGDANGPVGPDTARSHGRQARSRRARRRGGDPARRRAAGRGDRST